MRTTRILSLWLLVTAFAAGRARADISDPGDLLIGGQGVIQGTFTVQGAGGIRASSAVFTGTGGAYAVTAASGIALNAGCVRFPDGSSQCAPATGDVVTTADNTMSGYNKFTSSTNIQSVLELGSSVAGYRGRSPIVVWARSVDGATQSSGCVVALSMDSLLASAELVFTSTTSQPNSAYGVLFDDNCSPSSYCRVSINGIMRVQVGGAGPVEPGKAAQAVSTRCGVQGNTGSGFNHIGTFVTDASGGWATILLGPAKP